MAATSRLVVVLAAEFADCTRLTEANEEGGPAGWEALRKDIVYPKLAAHNGRIVRALGERLLAEFADPTEAVRCAVDVQRGLIGRNLDAAPDRRIALRIGVSMGKINASGDDLVSRAVAALPIDELATLIKPGTGIYGDGVNTAGLAASLADPGGICISGQVRDAVLDELPYAFEDIGEQELDTLAAPIRCYRLSAKALAAAPKTAAQYRQHASGGYIGLRGAAIAAGVLATIGVWAVALSSWLGTNSKTPASPPAIVGSQTPSASGAGAKDMSTGLPQATVATKTEDVTPLGSASQPLPPNNAASDTVGEATPETQPPLAADRQRTGATPTPATRPGASEIGALVVKGRQAPPAPRATAATAEGTAADGDAQEPQAAPDGVTAVFRGNQGEAAPQTMSGGGTTVVRGNQAPIRPQSEFGAGPEVVRGTRAASKI